MGPGACCDTEREWVSESQGRAVRLAGREAHGQHFTEKCPHTVRCGFVLYRLPLRHKQSVTEV